jgi:subfamily B ATP-binding cassette protein MsbA
VPSLRAISGITDYALAQLLGLAAQRSITDLRKKIQQHVQLLPVCYFDATKAGVLVSRVMNDAEGIRNLVGTGLVQLIGGVITAVIAIGILFYLSAKLAGMIAIGIAMFA